MGYILAYKSCPIFEFWAPKCHFRKWGKWSPGAIFPIVFLVTVIVWDRNKGLVATNKLKTMRRHPGIPPEGKRVPVQRLESSNSKQWGIFQPLPKSFTKWNCPCLRAKIVRKQIVWSNLSKGADLRKLEDRIPSGTLPHHLDRQSSLLIFPQNTLLVEKSSQFPLSQCPSSCEVFRNTKTLTKYFKTLKCLAGISKYLPGKSI